MAAQPIPSKASRSSLPRMVRTIWLEGYESSTDLRFAPSDAIRRKRLLWRFARRPVLRARR